MTIVPSRVKPDPTRQPLQLVDIGDQALARENAALKAHLHQVEQRLGAVLESVPMIMVGIDADGQVTEATGDGFEKAGVDPASLLGLNVFNHWGEQNEASQRVRCALCGEPQEGTFRSRRGNEWEYRLSPRRALGGEVVGVTAVAFDTRERQRSEAAIRENAAKSHFLAVISHELRTPLNSILGFSQLLDADAGGELSEKQRRYVRNIELSGRHLLSLINEVLDLSKVAAGEMEISLEEVDLAEIVEVTTDAVRPLAGARDQQLVVEALPPARVQADAKRLSQALTNLLANAIKFTPARGRISVAARRAGDCLEVSVTDTGVGIADEDQGRVFLEFAQLDAGRREGGTGLGLALTKQLVEAMGGTISVRSRLGQGSTFTLRLPAV